MAFKCPYCSSEAPPIMQKSGLNSTGLILLIVLVVFCFPLFWLPLVMDGMKEEVRKCSGCGNKIG